MWWIHLTGGDSGSGLVYLELSGFLSLLIPPLLTLAGIGLLWGWRNQCRVHRCYWPARRTTAAGDRVCWKHHPHPHKTFEQVCADHHLYLGDRAGKG
jgi:hypothetical protein